MIIECNRVEINDGVEYKTIKVIGREGLITTIEIHNARLKGEWVTDDQTYSTWRCNKCLHVQTICSNFCPNCGADMRGEGV